MADLTLLCGFVDDLAGFLGDRGYLSTIEQEVIVNEYRGVVMAWRHDWAKVACSVNFSNGVTLWLGDPRVRRSCKVLYRALHLIFSLGESYPVLPAFVTPDSTKLMNKGER